MILAHGGRADFRGKNGGVYCLLSHLNLALNAGISFVTFRMWNLRIMGSFFTELYLAARSFDTLALIHFEFAPNFPPAMLHLTNSTQPLRASELFVFEDITIKVEHQGLGKSSTHRLTQGAISNKGWTILATAKPITRAVGDNAGNFQLDFQLNPKENPLKLQAPHGLLGQSWDGDDIAVSGRTDNLTQMKQMGAKVGEFFEVTTRAQAEGAIEGVGDDYLVLSPFSSKFKFSRFENTGAQPRNITLLSGFKQHADYKAPQSPESAGTTGIDAIYKNE